MVAGLIITPAAFLLRRAQAGSAMLQRLRKNLLISIAATVISLVALELALAASWACPAIIPPRFHPLTTSRRPGGPAMRAAATMSRRIFTRSAITRPSTVWPCVVNQQGFYDRQDFVAWVDELECAPADNHTGGFVHLWLQRRSGQVFCRCHRVAGGEQRGLEYRDFGHRDEAGAGVIPGIRARSCKPHIAIYGMYVNDFDDNLLPIDGYFVGVNADGRPIGIRNHRVDKWGNLTEAGSSHRHLLSRARG